MPYKMFRVPVSGAAGAEEQLNAFLTARQVLATTKRFVEAGDESYWAFCIEYGEARSVAPAGKGSELKGRIDYRERLSPPDFAVYLRLRELRKEISAADSIAAFMVFTNEQLAAMVQGRVRTVEDLARIDGIGPARVEKYGTRFLTLLTEALGASR